MLPTSCDERERGRKEKERSKRGRKEEATPKTRESASTRGSTQQLLCFAAGNKVKVSLPLRVSSPKFEINLTAEYK